MKTNCNFKETCLKGEKCNKQISSENYIEAMVVFPECFKDIIKIKIEKPNFTERT